MYLEGKGNVVSQRSVNSKDNSKQYHFIKLIDDSNQELEMIMDMPIHNLERFALISFTVDVIQGKYPQYRLIKHDVI